MSPKKEKSKSNDEIIVGLDVGTTKICVIVAVQVRIISWIYWA